MIKLYYEVYKLFSYGNIIYTPKQKCSTYHFGNDMLIMLLAKHVRKIYVGNKNSDKSFITQNEITKSLN